MKKKILGIALILSAVLLIGIGNQVAVAETQVTISPLSDELSIKKTVIPMHVPEDNKFPWGSIKGEAAEIAERYPIIIQIYKENDPVHFAQVDAMGDGSFEYKFRIRNVDSETGISTNIYEGGYTVKIFRVIPNNSLTL